jgi:hypothetical protein
MATRFSASDARKKAKSVKKSIDEDTRKKTKAHGAEVEAAGPAIQPVVVDRGEADGGRVDDGRHFLS